MYIYMINNILFIFIFYDNNNNRDIKISKITIISVVQYYVIDILSIFFVKIIFSYLKFIIKC